MTASSDEVKRLLDFDSVDDTALFSPVDDAVMGGMSSSRLAPAGRGIAAFEGNKGELHSIEFAEENLTVNLDDVTSTAVDSRSAGIPGFGLCD